MPLARAEKAAAFKKACEEVQAKGTFDAILRRYLSR